PLVCLCCHASWKDIDKIRAETNWSKPMRLGTVEPEDSPADGDAVKKPRPWSEMATQLVDVATGRKPADLVVRNGRWVNVYSGEIVPDTDIAICGGRFAYCGPDASHAIGDGTEVIDAGGRYLVPGLCDAHMHVES